MRSKAPILKLWNLYILRVLVLLILLMFTLPVSLEAQIVTIDKPTTADGECIRNGTHTISGSFSWGDEKPEIEVEVAPSDFSGRQTYTCTIASDGKTWFVRNVNLGITNGIAEVTAIARKNNVGTRATRSLRIAGPPAIMFTQDNLPIPGQAPGFSPPVGARPTLLDRSSIRVDVRASSHPGQQVKVTLDGKPYRSGSKIEEAGDHLIVATAEPICAGHTTAVHLYFHLYLTPEDEQIIPKKEREALVALSRLTNAKGLLYLGSHKRKEDKECSWYGVECRFGHVVKLHLSSTRELIGSIPSEIGDLGELTELVLSGNKFTGSIPPSIARLSKLRILDLHENELSGNIPPGLVRLQKLETLDLHSNDLSGSIPPQLGKLTRLTRLSLHSNRLTGSIPSTLGQLSDLSTLELHSNSLSSAIPPELGNLVKLTELSLYSNELGGSIPPDLANLTELTELDISCNRLSGGIPPELFETSLRELDLSSNQLSGELPPTLGVSSLSHLDLSSNQLSGSIPGELGSTELRILSLASNNLSGSIPAELGKAESLERINLSFNRLSGTFRQNHTSFKRLSALYLHGNQFSGDIPTARLVGLIRGNENEYEHIATLEEIAPQAVDDFQKGNTLLGKPQRTDTDLLAAAEAYADVLKLAPDFDVALRRRGVALVRWARSNERSRSHKLRHRLVEGISLLDQAVSLKRSQENLYWLAKGLTWARLLKESKRERYLRAFSIGGNRCYLAGRPSRPGCWCQRSLHFAER